MPTSQNTCDEQRLRLFLNQQLDQCQVDIVERHLNYCQDCRNKIDDLAAGPEFWSAAGKRLNEVYQASSTKADIQPRTDLPQSKSVEAYLKTWLAPTDDPNSFGRLGCYEIVGIVGIGGMGIVLKGFDASLARFVAIKVLASHLASNGSARQRFAREARAAAAIVHENVLAIHSIDHWNDLPYFVMPYVRGESLEQRIKRQGPLETIEILRIAIQISAGLAAAHSQGLVHRDVKPANILLDEGSERLKISDFGLARTADDASLTQSGSIAGTPLFMSPEQARGESVCHRSDIFSFGSLLYTLCTGHPPFRAETPYGILRRICDDSPRQIQHSQPTIPFWLSGIIEKMMNKVADQRFESTDELVSLFRSGLSISQHPTADLPPELAAFVPGDSVFKKWIPNKALMSFIGLAVAISLALLVVGFATNWRNEAALQESSKEGDLSVQKNAATTVRIKEDERGTQLELDTGSKKNGTRATVDLPDLISSSPDQSVASTSGTIIDQNYRFLLGQKFSYLCELTISGPEFELVIEGTCDFKTISVLKDGAELNYQLNVSHRNSRRNVSAATIHSPWLLDELESQLAILANCETEGRIKVDYHGNIKGRSNPSCLPGGIGPFADWVFPVLPSSPLETYTTNREIVLPIGSSKTIEFPRPFESNFEEAFVTRESRFSLLNQSNRKNGIPIEVSTSDSQEDNSAEEFSNEISGSFVFDKTLGANLETKIEAITELNNRTTKTLFKLKRVAPSSVN
jgi:serine/threonine-protein kinase